MIPLKLIYTDLQIYGQLNIEIRGLIMYQELLIAKKYNTLDEFFNSEELKEIYRPYASSELDRFKRVTQRFEFLAAYVVKRNPEENYGRSFDLYKHYKLDTKVMLKKISALSFLGNYEYPIASIETKKIIITDNADGAKNNNAIFLN